MKKWCLILPLLIVLVTSCAKQQSHLVQPDVAELRGQLYGYLEIPRADWPVEKRPEVLGYLGKHQLPIGYTTISLSADSLTYTLQRTLPTDSLELTVGGQPAELQADGSFIVHNVPLGTQTVIFSYRGLPVRTQSVEIVAGQHKLELQIQRVVDTCCEMTSQHPTANQSTTSIPCLDNNGFGPSNFIYSDCYVSLLYGPPWYSWMCWSEAMDRFHDHYGNIWCNGSHNCSLWVHGWDWNKQYWHRHSWPWAPRW